MRIPLELRTGERPEPLQVVLNQAFDRHWSATAGELLRMPSGKIGLRLTPAPGIPGRVDLRFDDPASRSGARVSVMAWRGWLGVALLAVILAARRSSIGYIEHSEPRQSRLQSAGAG